MGQYRPFIRSLNIRFPWTDALARPRDPLPPGQRDLTDRGAWQRVRPRSRKDRLFFLWAALIFSASLALALILRGIIRIDPQQRQQLRQSTAPGSINPSSSTH
jgi:hypothetical protein